MKDRKEFWLDVLGAVLLAASVFGPILIAYW